MGNLVPEEGSQGLMVVPDEIDDLERGGVGLVSVSDQILEGIDASPGLCGVGFKTNDLNMGEGGPSSG